MAIPFIFGIITAMNFTGTELLSLLENPGILLGNATYLLIAASVLMRNIAWLRALAILGGLGKIAYRTLYVYDPTSIFWEAVFVIINIVQLLIIWWENRKPVYTDEERQFVETVVPGLVPAAARALLDSGNWADLAPGTTLTTAGQRVNALIYVAGGDVRIESKGVKVGSCGPGDFIGEMTYASGDAATATAIANGPVRVLRFERRELDQVQMARPVLKMALQASFNRNLIAKLMRANQIPQLPAVS